MMRRLGLVAAACAAGIGAAWWLSGLPISIPIEDHRFHGFGSPAAQGAEGVRWAGPEARVDLPDTGWRPLRIQVALRARTDGRPVPVTVTIDGQSAGRFEIGREPQLLQLTYAVAAGTRSPLPLQLVLAPGDAWRVGLLDISARPLVRDANVWSIATGAWHLVRRAIGEFVRVAVLLFLVLFPGWFVLDAVRGRLPPALRDAVVLLSLPATVIAIGTLTIGLQAAHARPDIFLLAALLMYTLPLAIVMADRERRRRAWREWREARLVLLLPALVAFGAMCYASVGLSSLDAIGDWTRPAWRGLHELPIDNAANWLASQTWRAHLPANTSFSFPWRIGDRGPLLAVLHLFLSSAFEGPAPSYAQYTRLGIVLNALFLGPLFVWLAAMLGRRRGWLCAALVGLNPWVFLNIYYTWPKLLGVYFLVVAVWLLWRRSVPKTPAVWATSGGLMGLSALAHTGALLSVPIILLITAAGFVRSRRAALGMALAPIALVAVLTPWNTYKRWYSPESYSLFYSNFLDNAGYFTPLGQNVSRFVREHPLSEQVSVRAGHLQDLWIEPLRDGVVLDFWRARGAGGRLYSNEFFAPWFSAGMIWFVWIVVAWPLAFVLRGRVAMAPGNADVPLWPAAVFALLGLTVNAALRWRGPLSHELPYFEIVLLAVVMVAVFARLGRAWLGLAMATIVARQAYYFLESARVSRLNLPGLDASGRLYWLTLAGILLITFLVRRSDSMVEHASTPPAP